MNDLVGTTTLKRSASAESAALCIVAAEIGSPVIGEGSERERATQLLDALAQRCAGERVGERLGHDDLTCGRGPRRRGNPLHSPDRTALRLLRCGPHG